MTFPASASPSVGSVFENMRNVAANAKAQAQNALTTLQTSLVNTDFVFRLLDQVNGLIGYLNQVKNTAGLDAYATAQVAGYAGPLTTDTTAVINAAQAIINWTVTNFPVDTGGYIQAYKLNADGSRTPTSFNSTQTAGLQTALQNFIATIG